jgi:hypothetical protein
VGDETSDALGELDWDFPESSPPAPLAPTAPPSPLAQSSRQTVRRDEAAMEGATMPPPAGGIDHPDADVDIEVGEVEVDDPLLAHGIPRVLLGPQEIAKLPIDHRAGFLLGFIDGMQTLEEILDVCAMPPSEALDLIRALVEMNVIALE